MANEVALTATSIRDASPVDLKPVKINLIAAVAITKGQIVYMNTSGKAALADASAAGTAGVAGVALSAAAIGQPVLVLVSGFCYGFTLTSEAYGEIMLLSDTAGAIDDGGGSPTVTAPVGVVWALSDSNATKVLWVNPPYNLTVTPS